MRVGDPYGSGLPTRRRTGEPLMDLTTRRGATLCGLRTTECS